MTWRPRNGRSSDSRLFLCAFATADQRRRVDHAHAFDPVLAAYTPTLTEAMRKELQARLAQCETDIVPMFADFTFRELSKQ